MIHLRPSQKEAFPVDTQRLSNVYKASMRGHVERRHGITILSNRSGIKVVEGFPIISNLAVKQSIIPERIFFQVNL